MQLRLIEYFVALAREEHFARAAEACSVSQPTLSMGIATLEEQLGHRLVERDRRYIGLTAEGRAALPWAQQVVAAIQGFGESMISSGGGLNGNLRLGAIPASMPVTGYWADSLRASHPQVTLSIRSLTSREISQGLAAYALDAGLTYIDHEPPVGVTSVPLYGERFVFVAADGSGFAPEGSIPLAAALEAPLCLLHTGMQNRRILDEQLALRGLAAAPQATADSYLTLVALLRSGCLATLMPDSYAALLPAWARISEIKEPLPRARIGLVVPDRPPLPPLALAALAAAQRLQLPAEFGRS